jgi:hypothetical protein
MCCMTLAMEGLPQSASTSTACHASPFPATDYPMAEITAAPADQLDFLSAHVSAPHTTVQHVFVRQQFAQEDLPLIEPSNWKSACPKWCIFSWYRAPCGRYRGKLLFFVHLFRWHVPEILQNGALSMVLTQNIWVRQVVPSRISSRIAARLTEGNLEI